jgi:hypothetical protein
MVLVLSTAMPFRKGTKSVPLIPTGIFLTDNSRFSAQYSTFQYTRDLAFYYSNLLHGWAKLPFVSKVRASYGYLLSGCTFRRTTSKQIGVNSRNERLHPIYWIRCDSHADFDLGSLLRTLPCRRIGPIFHHCPSNMTCISSTTLFPLSCNAQRSLGQTYAPNCTVAMSSKLNKTGALSFLDHIKSQFEDEPSRYQDFLNLMKDYKLSRFVVLFFWGIDIRSNFRSRIDNNEVVLQICELFNGYPSLVKEFNAFLPHGYTLEPSGLEESDEAYIRLNTPEGVSIYPRDYQKIPDDLH